MDSKLYGRRAATTTKLAGMVMLSAAIILVSAGCGGEPLVGASERSDVPKEATLVEPGTVEEESTAPVPATTTESEWKATTEPSRTEPAEGELPPGNVYAATISPEVRDSLADVPERVSTCPTSGTAPSPWSTPKLSKS
jgi:hypothetical protein